MVRSQPLGRDRPGTSGTVESSEDQPPRSEPVGAWLGRRHQTLVGAATDAVGHPLRECLRIGRRPAAVLLEPRVGAPDRLGGGYEHGSQSKGAAGVRERGARGRVAFVDPMETGQPEPPAPYWRGADEDRAMQDEHGFIWQAIVDTVDMDLAGLRALDAGCNQGGFLRLLVDRCGIAEGYGYDPAAGAIDDARRLAGGRRLTFAAGPEPPPEWGRFDVAFSHEVIYLLHDLPAHAGAMLGALEPGGAYFATMGVHSASRLMSDWHASHSRDLGLPRLYALDEVADVFSRAGFEVSAGRLRFGLVPLDAHRADHSGPHGLLDWLDYYAHDKVIFRFTHPTV